MSMAERLRSTLIVIGENDPGDLSACSAKQIAEIIEHVGQNSHRDAPSAVSMAEVLIAEKRKEG